MATVSISLPSRGILYDGKIPNGNVTLNTLTSKEQGILFNQALDATQKFDAILKNCVEKPAIPVTDFLMTDRLYLIIVLRTCAFGSLYRFPNRCSSCRAQTVQEIDISKVLKVKAYQDAATIKKPDDDTICLGSTFKEPFIRKLPVSGDEVEFRLLRGYDEQSIAMQAKRLAMQSVDVSDPSFLLRLSLMIQKVNGKELSQQEKVTYAVMDAGDENDLSNYIESIESGIDLTFYSTCKACGFEDEAVMPFTAEFFRPKYTRVTGRAG